MTVGTTAARTQRCPCSSGDQLQACCGRYLNPKNDNPKNDGGQPRHAPTAEALMRSRFSAFALGDAGYLLRTWHPDTRPEILDLDPDQRWHLLEILATSQGGPFDYEGVVRFRAHYHSAANRKVRDSFTETSTFCREGSQWYYVQALENS